MAKSASKHAKRKAGDGLPRENKRGKIDGGKQTQKKSCILCEEINTTFPKVSKDCKGSHSNDVCRLCWMKYIKIQVMEEAHEDIRCVQYNVCNAYITHEDLERIASRKVVDHYDWLIRRKKAEENGEIECLGDVTDTGNNRVTCHHFQNHDESKDGRAFVCEKCGNQKCVRCGVREHQSETCDIFQTRLRSEHGKEEEETARSFRDGYKGREKGVWKIKRPKPCPSCGQMIEREDNCVRCANEFCVNCNAPYYGKNSVPEIGNKAHKEGCAYFSRTKEDRRFKRRVKSAGPQDTPGEVTEDST